MNADKSVALTLASCQVRYDMSLLSHTCDPKCAKGRRPWPLSKLFEQVT